ncbi:MAG: branched-chain amino acid ABC transporter permease [Gammaproteobacteria bacterium]
MNSVETKTLVLGAFALGLAALLPLSNNGYLISLGVTVAMYTVLATSWAMFSGPTHYISLATGAFYGVGTYVVALGIDHIPYAVLLLLALGAGALLAALVGLVTLRLSGVYFVIFTLGLAEMIRQIVTWVQNNLSGHRGLYVLTDITEEIIYWELLVVAGLVYLLGWWIGRSRLGFALLIIGNDEQVAAHCGINTARSKVILFVVSGMVASLTGAVLAPRWTYIEPSLAFSAMLSFQVVIMALLGGAGRLWGPVLGVIPFTLLWEVISAQFPNQTTLLLGIAFLLIVFAIPDGVAGHMETLLRYLRERRAS